MHVIIGCLIFLIYPQLTLPVPTLGASRTNSRVRLNGPSNSLMPPGGIPNKTNGIEMQTMKSSKMSFGRGGAGSGAGGGRQPPNKNQVVPVIELEVRVNDFIFIFFIETNI